MKINITNTEKIQAALDGIQRKCTERCYDAKDLQKIAAEFECEMKKCNVSRAMIDGCKIHFGGRRQSKSRGTVGTIIFTANSAFLVELARKYCTLPDYAALTDVAKATVIKYYTSTKNF